MNIKPEKSILTYEHVILQTLNFNIRPPFQIIVKHMKSILIMIDKDIEDILDQESYQQYVEQFRNYQKERKKELAKKKRERLRS